MAKTRSMTRSQNHDDTLSSSSSSSRKRFKTFDNSCVGPWSDLNHDVLFLVMMQLGFIDFISMSEVCKSWRSFALSNRITFMASKPPMKICIEPHANNQDSYICLKEDFKGKNFKTILPHSAGRKCFGLTCGYMILFSRETRDFWLVNPITRHELHFPDFPLYVGVSELSIRGILVFSPSIGWVFVVLLRRKKISFSIIGKRGWNHVSSILPIRDLHVFKGKIYTIHIDCSLRELRLGLKQKHKWVLFETMNFSNAYVFKPRLVSSSENIYVMSDSGILPEKVMELDFGEMKWVSPEKTIREYAFFVSYLNYSAIYKLDSRAPYTSYEYFLDDDKSGKCMFYYERMWYFPHDCLTVNRLDE